MQKELDLYRVALKLQEARNNRDKDHPKFNSKWHTITDIFNQMSRDISRNTDQWLHYVKKNMLIKYGKVRYTPLRVQLQKEANKRYHRRKAIIERRKKSKELRATYSLKQIEKWKKDSERLRKKRK
jgi:hypothetical protein